MKNGLYRTLDVPGSFAGVPGTLPTVANGINPAGDIVGTYRVPFNDTAPFAWAALTASMDALPGGRPEGLEPCQTLQKGPQSEPAFESLFSQFERVVWLPPQRSTETPIAR
jgi:hypothetical protein